MTAGDPPIFYPGWRDSTWIPQRAYFPPSEGYYSSIPTQDRLDHAKRQAPFEIHQCPPCCPLLRHPTRIVKHPDGTTEIFWDSE